MQCPSCYFENMPGVRSCGRCGAVLQCSAVAINVHPPRARAWVKRCRRWFSSFLFAWRRTTEMAAWGLVGADASESPPWPAMARMVAPGWPQIYQGNRPRGLIFLAVWGVLAALALVTAGTSIGSVCLGLALAVHASSALDLILAATRQSRGRITYALFSLIAIGFVVYAPLGYVAGGLLVPQRIAANMPPFFRGDVVLTSPATYSTFRHPECGDVVLYEVPSATIAGRYGPWAANIAIRGQRIDRILATSGQHVQIEGGKLLVDGQPSPYLPLNRARMPERFTVSVPPGCFFILPTTALGEQYDLRGLPWQHVSLVSADQIISRVYARHWPWTRFTLF